MDENYQLMQILGVPGVDQAAAPTVPLGLPGNPQRVVASAPAKNPVQPLMNVVRPQQPMTGDLFQQLIARQTQGLADQREGIKKLEADYDSYKGQQTNPLTAILAGASDMVNKGGNLYQQYMQNEGQKRQQVMDLGTKIQGGKNSITDNEIALLKAQYDNQYRKDQLQTMKDIAGMKATAAANKPHDIKDYQAQAAGFGRRMQQAEQVFKNLAKSGYNRADRGQNAQAWLPGELQNESLRSQSQAERNFVNALLRRESGSAISPSEFKSAEEQYFPRPGDTDANLAQKAANRAQAVASMEVTAGPAWAAVPLISTAPPASPDGIQEWEGKKYKANANGDWIEVK